MIKSLFLLKFYLISAATDGAHLNISANLLNIKRSKFEQCF